jgi:hypothetical protein
VQPTFSSINSCQRQFPHNLLLARFSHRVA